MPMAPRIEVDSYLAGTTLELTVSGFVDIASAATFKERLVAALTPACDVVVKLDALDKLDGAGLQLLLAAKAHVERAGHSFVIGSLGEVAQRAIETAGAAPLLISGGEQPHVN
jgi:anti-anti-sigma factor